MSGSTPPAPEGPSIGHRDESAAGSPDVGGRSARGFGHALFWSYVLSGGSIAVNLILSLVLARLLGPEAFGLLAMANVYIFFVELLVRQGMPAALIQRPDLDRRHLDTAFWMVLAVIGLLVPTTLGLSGWWASVNRLPELQPVIIALTPVLILKGMSVVQESQLRRRMEYRLLAIRTTSAVVAGGIVGVGLAYAGVGVWALVAQQLVLSLVEVVVLWRVSDWRPRFSFDWQKGRDLLGFSGFSSLAGIAVFIENKVDALLIGLMFGPVAVGLYRMASKLTSQVANAVFSALQSVSLPELSRFATDPSGLNRRVAELVRLSAVISVPAIGALAVIAGPLLLLLDQEWLPATTALQLLCLAAVLQVPTALTGPLLQAAGRPGLLSVVTWVAALMSGAAFVFAGAMVGGRPLAAQLTALALSRVLALAIWIGAVVLPVLSRSLGLNARAIARGVVPIAVAVSGGVAMSLVILDAASISTVGSPLLQLACAAGVALVVVGGASLAAEPLARALVIQGWLRVTQSLVRSRRSGGRTPTPPADSERVLEDELVAR